MLVIRMQRTGRAGHAMFRVVVQDSRRTPTSGKVAAALGSYDPHTKAVTLDKDKAQFYLDHGAQPSGRVAYLLKEQGVKLPKWVTPSTKQERSVRNADKRRSTRPEAPEQVEGPPEPVAEAAPEAPSEAETTEAPSDEAPAEVETAEAPVEEKSEAVETAETPIEVEAAEPAAAEAEPAESEPNETPAEPAEPEAAAEDPKTDK